MWPPVSSCRTLAARRLPPWLAKSAPSHTIATTHGRFARSAGLPQETPGLESVTISTDAPRNGRDPGVTVPGFGAVNTVAYNFAQQHGLSFSNRLMPLSVKSSLGFKYKYSLEHCIHSWYDHYFYPQGHPFMLFALDYALNDHRQKALWYTPITMSGNTPVVCNKTKRRVRQQLQLALEERGYDIWGKKVAPNDKIVELYGSLRISSFSPLKIWNTSKEEIRADMRTLVAAIEPLLGRDESGRQISGQVTLGRAPARGQAKLESSKYSRLPNNPPRELKSQVRDLKEQRPHVRKVLNKQK
jgi:hypothetical protein